MEFCVFVLHKFSWWWWCYDSTLFLRSLRQYAYENYSSANNYIVFSTFRLKPILSMIEVDKQIKTHKHTDTTHLDLSMYCKTFHVLHPPVAPVSIKTVCLIYLKYHQHGFSVRRGVCTPMKKAWWWWWWWSCSSEKYWYERW